MRRGECVKVVCIKEGKNKICRSDKVVINQFYYVDDYDFGEKEYVNNKTYYVYSDMGRSDYIGIFDTDNFVTLAKFRENRINSILDEN